MSNLGFGHMGSGIVVWDRTKIKHNDYLKIATINQKRVITWYNTCSDDEKKEIEHYTATANPNVSTTQDTPVFTEKR